MANLTDADKVLRNDTGKDIVTQLTAIKTAIENGGGGGGGDYANKNIAVTFDTETSYNEGDYVIYSGNLYRAKNDVSAGTWSGSTDWESITVGEQLNLKAFTVLCNQAQYDTWNGTTPKSFPLLNAYYVITDAPNLNPTASDIEYSSGVSVADELDDLSTIKDISAQATVQTGFALKSWGSVTVKQIGKLVYVVINGLYSSSNISTATNAIELPKVSNGYGVFNGSDDDRNTVLMTMSNNSNMMKIDTVSANKNIFASFVYLTI